MGMKNCWEKRTSDSTMNNRPILQFHRHRLIIQLHQEPIERKKQHFHGQLQLYLVRSIDPYTRSPQSILDPPPNQTLIPRMTDPLDALPKH